MRELLTPKSKLKEWLGIDACVLLVGIMYYFFLYIFQATCLIKLLFSIECPTCRMTRAILSLMRLDFKGYFENNFLALPTLVVLYMNLHAKYFNKKWLEIGTIVTAIAVFVRYILNFIF